MAVAVEISSEWDLMLLAQTTYSDLLLSYNLQHFCYYHALNFDARYQMQRFRLNSTRLPIYGRCASRIKVCANTVVSSLRTSATN